MNGLKAAWDAAIVDLDGTMVDTLGDFDLALNRSLAAMGLPGVSRDFIEHTVGKGSRHLLMCTLSHVGADADRLEELWETYQKAYVAINGQASAVFPGVAEGLAALRQAGLKLACLTNKPRAFALPLLEAKLLAPFFDHVFGGDSFDKQKPDPLPLLKTCEALGIAPARTLMIGDSSNDARAARAAGCPVVLMRYGYNHGEPPEFAHPDAVLDRLDALGAVGTAPMR